MERGWGKNCVHHCSCQHLNITDQCSGADQYLKGWGGAGDRERINGVDQYSGGGATVGTGTRKGGWERGVGERGIEGAKTGYMSTLEFKTPDQYSGVDQYSNIQRARMGPGGSARNYGRKEKK